MISKKKKLKFIQELKDLINIFAKECLENDDVMGISLIISQLEWNKYQILTSILTINELKDLTKPELFFGG